jgi:hypothetical protein
MSGREHEVRAGEASLAAGPLARAPQTPPSVAEEPSLKETRADASASSAGLREVLRRVPRVAWICALIAFLNAVSWAFIVPPFQGKDEADHFAYVETIVENGSLPENGKENATYSEAENIVLRAVDYPQVTHSPQNPDVLTAREHALMDRALNTRASLRTSGEAGIATAEPPLYYLIQTVPYLLARGHILDQLQLMRLVGALFGAATALLTFLFIAEVLPGRRWAAVVAGLCVALQPLLAFMSGSVNPDAMLYPVCAAVFLCFARAFRRGLTLRLGLTIGALTAVGFLTKLGFLGFAFGVFVGLLVLAVRELRARGVRSLSAPAAAACIGIAPVAVYMLHNALTSHPTYGIVSGHADLLAVTPLFHMFSYIWQLYLPRVPGMPHYFVGISTSKDIWWNRSVGLYGWMDTMFPLWVDNVALIPAAIIAALCGRGLYVQRAALRRRLPELGVYVAFVIGTLVVIGGGSYLSDALHGGASFGEPRYLVPLVPLLGLIVALAIRGAGKRWFAVAGAALVIVFLGHDIFSQLQTIARYYG